MQKRKIIKASMRVLLSILIFYGFFLFASTINAEESTETNPDVGITEPERTTPTTGMHFKTSTEGTILFDDDVSKPVATIAEISIENAKIISQDDNRFQISFQIINKSAWIQPNIKYGVFLVAEGNDELFIEGVGKQIYDEELSLEGGEILKRSITYLAPPYLSGKYSLLIESKLPSGLPLMAQEIDDPITLNGSDLQFLEIVPSSCYLSIEGNQAGKRYGVLEGIAVDSQKEKLVGICQVTNHTNKQVKFTPEFKIYQRSIFGDKVEGVLPKLGEFQFEPNETKIIVLPLPIDLDPQAYDAEVFLKSQKGIISNPVVMHYVIKGVSATIQNIAFDKTSYLVGDTARLSFFWNGSADQFSNSRIEGTETKNLTVNVLVKDKTDDHICGQIERKINLEKPIAYLAIPITKDCEESFIVSVIKDEVGNILAQRESQSPQRNKNFFLKNNKIIAISILAILFVIFLVITFAMNSKTNNKKKKGSKYKYIINKK